MTNENELAYWRNMIDRTDRDLCQLIAKRMSCAREVARIKADHERQNPDAPVIYYRPGREAQMMRLLASAGAAQAGQFPAAGLIQIWRELISASIEHQANGLRVAAQGKEGAAVSRAHFGAASDIKDRENPLDDLAGGKVLVAVMPWASLLEHSLRPGQSVVAALPFVGAPTHAVIGQQQPEASGDDLAVYLVDRYLAEGFEEPDCLASNARAALIYRPYGDEPPACATNLGLFASSLDPALLET